ncbi:MULTISPECIES: hypothetical protein [unclassified Sphingomonas]|uniref:hypothetical protein n=1 Tax=unclassified Sphingomonas TaxID=196159 RepID=UPI00226A2F69|nr:MULTISPECIES: hypothetical protein [unclassified Sphingomonas]
METMPPPFNPAEPPCTREPFARALTDLVRLLARQAAAEQYGQPGPGVASSSATIETELMDQ